MSRFSLSEEIAKRSINIVDGISGAIASHGAELEFMPLKSRGRVLSYW